MLVVIPLLSFFALGIFDNEEVIAVPSPTPVLIDYLPITCTMTATLNAKMAKMNANVQVPCMSEDKKEWIETAKKDGYVTDSGNVNLSKWFRDLAKARTVQSRKE